MWGGWRRGDAMGLEGREDEGDRETERERERIVGLDPPPEWKRGELQSSPVIVTPFLGQGKSGTVSKGVTLSDTF